MKSKLTLISNTRGFGLLIAVIFVAAAITGIIIAGALFTRSEISSVDRAHQINQVYYAAEGSIYETLQHIHNDLNWPTEADFSDSYTIDSVIVTRSIISSGEHKEVDVTAEKGRHQTSLAGRNWFNRRRLQID